MKSGTCPKCESTDVIAAAKIVDHVLSFPIFTMPLTVKAEEPAPGALIKSGRTASLKAWICRACGYTELYTENPQSLPDPTPTDKPK